jgi:hypothetical protein
MAEEKGDLDRRSRIERLINMIYNEPDVARRADLIRELESEEQARPDADDEGEGARPGA